MNLIVPSPIPFPTPRSGGRPVLSLIRRSVPALALVAVFAFPAESVAEAAFIRQRLDKLTAEAEC